MIKLLQTTIKIRVLRYLTAGAFVASLYVVLFSVFNDLLLFNVYLSVSFSFFISAFVRFIINREWVFQSNKGIIDKQTLKYIFMLISTYILNIALTSVLLLSNFFLTSIEIAILSTLFSTLFAYTISIYWVFKGD